MYDGLTVSAEELARGRYPARDSLLLVEWPTVELSGCLYENLAQDHGRFDRWPRDFGGEVCQNQTHAHRAGPTATEQLARIDVPFLPYVRRDHDVDDAREIALALAFAGADGAARGRRASPRWRLCRISRRARTMRRFANSSGYRADEYDRRKAEAKLNSYPQFLTEIDGLDMGFIHVRSKHENALPLIVRHVRPGSLVEHTVMSADPAQALDGIVPCGSAGHVSCQAQAVRCLDCAAAGRLVI
ncbi:epoxide hydrolase N-terminal domain-containing protein [Streptomyces sp. NPDC001185]|uniref:epoxide hydrolase N-terminal domain-containing protein n=1 Tax=Streptomyces sp. NPDC001185 TaxID=3154380 RepID=UPI003318A4F3